MGKYKHTQAYAPILQGDHDGDGSPADATNTGAKAHEAQQYEDIIWAALLQVERNHDREAARLTLLVVCSRVVCPNHVVWVGKVCGRSKVRLASLSLVEIGSR